MTILDKLSNKEVWLEFCHTKTARNQFSKREQRELASFIEAERYLPITASFSFGYPTKKQIVKMASTKKRTVYTYSSDETWVLKLLANLLYCYDEKLSPSCYSFRRHITAKTAFDKIMKISDLDEKYVLKLDIHNYFNSIDVGQLIEILEETIDDDPKLLDFLKMLLKQDKCIYEGTVIEEKRGAMAGVPLASFFANLYLNKMDKEFDEARIPYFRYSDDILVFASDEKELESCYNVIKEHLANAHLEINKDKTAFIKPHEEWEFLGFSYKDGALDLSNGAIEKLKGKIRRKARKLYRWRIRNSKSYETAAQAMIRSFDSKFYDMTGNGEFTWSRFYFPILNTDRGLHEIDEFMQQYLRFLKTGRHYKGNYRIEYDKLKSLGYTPLVSEFHNWKEDNARLNKAYNEQKKEKQH